MLDKKKLIMPAVLAVVLGIGVATGSLSGCVATGNGQGVEALESMSETEFAKWRLYISLTTKIASSRLISNGLVKAEDVALAAEALKLLREQPIVEGGTSLIKPVLEDVGLGGSEIELLLLVVEQELLSRGALDYIDPETGLVALSPRTKDVLAVVENSLRAATEEVTQEESQQAQQLETEFRGEILK